MADPTLGLHDALTALVPDAAYAGVATAMIRAARGHCMATVFIVDPDPIEDDALVVDALLGDMADAAWRGVDTRLVIGGSRENGDILDACLLARSRAQTLGVPCRMVAATDQRSTHIKMLVADDHVLLGSHNWSPGALAGPQRQDSVLVTHGGFAGFGVGRILEQWAIARAEGFDVPD